MLFSEIYICMVILVTDLRSIELFTYHYNIMNRGLGQWPFGRQVFFCACKKIQLLWSLILLIPLINTNVHWSLALCDNTRCIDAWCPFGGWTMAVKVKITIAPCSAASGAPRIAASAPFMIMAYDWNLASYQNAGNYAKWVKDCISNFSWKA